MIINEKGSFMLSGHISNCFCFTINPHGYDIENGFD